MIYTIYGVTDKRLVAYPFIYSLNVLGRVAVLTDDTSFLQLTKGERKFDVNNVTISVLPLDTITKEQVNCYLDEGYDYAVVVNAGNAPSLADTTTLHVLCGTDQAEENAITISYEQPKDKKDKMHRTLVKTDTMLRELAKMEGEQLLRPSKLTAKVLASVFAPLIDKSEKDTYKLLIYKFKKGVKK